MKIKIYIDASNIYLGAKNHSIDLDIYKLCEYLKDKYYADSCAFFCPNLDVYTKITNSLEDAGIKVVVKKVYQDTRKLKANCDVEISRAITEDVLNKKVDKIVLLSGDGDFYSLLQFAEDSGVKVKLISISKKETSKLYRNGGKFGLTYIDQFKDLVQKGKALTGEPARVLFISSNISNVEELSSDIAAGKLIVIEGCDGAGKETQTKMLKEALLAKGVKVATLDFPRYKDTVGGKLLALALGKNPEFTPDFKFSQLQPEVASLLYAMDRKESAEYVKELLVENDVVILDRYYTANLLHQGAKFGSEVSARNEFIKLITTIELDLLQIPKPDTVLYLTIPFDTFESRMKSRRENQKIIIDTVESDEQYVKSSINMGESIAEYCGWQMIRGVEAGRELSREEVHRKVLAVLGF